MKDIKESLEVNAVYRLSIYDRHHDQWIPIATSKSLEELKFFCKLNGYNLNDKSLKIDEVITTIATQKIGADELWYYA